MESLQAIFNHGAPRPQRPVRHTSSPEPTAARMSTTVIFLSFPCTSSTSSRILYGQLGTQSPPKVNMSAHCTHWSPPIPLREPREHNMQGGCCFEFPVHGSPVHEVAVAMFYNAHRTGPRERLHRRTCYYPRSPPSPSAGRDLAHYMRAPHGMRRCCQSRSSYK